jgi:hypothetical protein
VGDRKKRRSSSFLDGDKTRRGDVVEDVWRWSSRDNLEVEQDQGRSRSETGAFDATKGCRRGVLSSSEGADGRFIRSDVWRAVNMGRG